MLNSLDRNLISVNIISAAKFFPMEIKNSSLSFEMPCLSNKVYLEAFMLTIFVDWDRLISS